MIIFRPTFVTELCEVSEDIFSEGSLTQSETHTVSLCQWPFIDSQWLALGCECQFISVSGSS